MGHVGGRRFSVGELHAASKTSSANGSHLNVWGFDISTAEFPQQTKTRVFGVNRPLGPIHTKDARFFSAAEILLRIYQNPMHLNGAGWWTTFFRRRTSRCLQNLVRQRVPSKCMGFWYIRSRISAAEKTCVFGVNRPLGFLSAAEILLRKFCCGYIKTPYI